MAEKAFWNNYGFERTVWANMQLAKVCPGNNIQKLDELLSNPDTEKQFNSMMDIVEVMNKAFIRKYSKLEPESEYKAITREEMLDLDEDELGKLTVLAMGKYKENGEIVAITTDKRTTTVLNGSILLSLIIDGVGGHVLVLKLVILVSELMSWFKDSVRSVHQDGGT